MWTRRHSQFYPDLRKEQVWEIWTDINNWPSWHEKLDSCQLEGPFEVGRCFLLKPKGGRAVRIELTDIQVNQTFSDCTRFPGAKMHDTHCLEERYGGLVLSNELRMTGPLAFFWFWLVGRHVAASIPAKTEALVRMVRSRDGQ